MTKPTLIIDGDGVLYTAAAACEREVRWDDENHVLSSNAMEAFGAVEHIINGHKTTLGADNVVIALSGPHVFRHELFPGYKAGRSRKPLCYARLVEMLREAYTVRSVDCLEADDLMGIWATNGKLKHTIIVSADKDMLTIPGKVYRGGELHEVTEDHADFRWMLQTLTGDVTDGYSGCPGIGERRATEILELAVEHAALTTAPPIVEMWERVIKTYEAKGLSEEDALLQARLARILRSSDWDSANQKVKLWVP